MLVIFQRHSQPVAQFPPMNGGLHGIGLSLVFHNNDVLEVVVNKRDNSLLDTPFQWVFYSIDNLGNRIKTERKHSIATNFIMPLEG